MGKVTDIQEVMSSKGVKGGKEWAVMEPRGVGATKKPPQGHSFETCTRSSALDEIEQKKS